MAEKANRTATARCAPCSCQASTLPAGLSLTREFLLSLYTLFSTCNSHLHPGSDHRLCPPRACQDVESTFV